jgi:hypothetical protein
MISLLTAYCSLLTAHYTKKSPPLGGVSMARDKESPPPLTPREELLLKVAKEIVVKFIEVGRISPSSFADTFTMVIDTLRQSLKPGGKG